MMNWIDIETTGLDPETGYLLEVGCIITDDALNEVARISFLIDNGVPVDDLIDMSGSFVREMHTENGLWHALRAGSGLSIDDVEWKMRQIVVKHGDDKHPLCGSSVHFDRSWLKKHMAGLEAALHYRNIDVSTIKELYRRFCPDEPAFEGSGKKHRVLDDLDNSIAELRFYLAAMGWEGR